MSARRTLSAAVGAAAMLFAAGAGAAESWNSPCLLDLRQIKEDWTRLSNDRIRADVSREVTRAEQNYRRGQEQRCQQRVAYIKELMK